MSLMSMTAFARQSVSGEWGELVWEIKSVNHRYLDINFRLPERLREIEMPLRELIQSKLNRGKVDISCQYNPSSISQKFSVDEGMVAGLLQAQSDLMSQHSDVISGLNTKVLLQWPGVMRVEAQNMTTVYAAARQAMSEALDKMLIARQREGEKIANMLLPRLQATQHHVKDLKPIVPEIIAQYKKKLQDNITVMGVQADEDRIAHEVALMAQKLDVTEEMDRLQAHCDEVAKVIKDGKVVGRRLDFLMQELNREANTLSSKSSHHGMTKTAVDMKVLIEQMREQVQNVE